RNFSKVSARQFQRFFERIDAEIHVAPEAMQYFDKRLIEEVFLVKEYAFNSAVLRKMLLERLASRNVDIRLSEGVQTVSKGEGGLIVATDKATYGANYVLNTTYSSINVINTASGLSPLSLKHELTEMCLVKMPSSLDG